MFTKYFFLSSENYRVHDCRMFLECILHSMSASSFFLCNLNKNVNGMGCSYTLVDVPKPNPKHYFSVWGC